jgi:hypothetical protein
MTIELLIHAIVRQTTILIAQLATSMGVRAPLAQIANQVSSIGCGSSSGRASAAMYVGQSVITEGNERGD